ncbi:MAG: hypothetical protein KJZ59_02070 [Pararhodobacter sp.]|nr:hypothetical protein [Pararhodobacter sp.]
MNFLSDLLLAAAAFGAAAYCFILSRRLTALGSLEGGMGSAIAILSSQVDDLTRLLKTAQQTAGSTGSQLGDQTARAEAVARRLELLMASMHDLPSASPPASDRAPTRWPADAGQRRAPNETPVTDDDEGADAPPARARILRRRRDQGSV